MPTARIGEGLFELPPMTSAAQSASRRRTGEWGVGVERADDISAGRGVRIYADDGFRNDHNFQVAIVAHG
ncbi:MAG: hypothetical protein ING66_09335 [Rhodocyclaceae bacterium]|nr:hypothetical protein [Rhodocyclaceae bacterium]MCA3025330.1 hypothetical protein [Rhodocyclaceae bacterium]MCA3028788.1 hypothetical protein [Rhodocyclaceae bacterium]MCA3037347.1 hypothetical protein [Rhodocyclaceae bacterium]MCA3040987.1 hypothetical protein [Rhodocyclaceae bacterium]